MAGASYGFRSRGLYRGRRARSPRGGGERVFPDYLEMMQKTEYWHTNLEFETSVAAREKALLRLLAEREAERFNLIADPRDIAETESSFRKQHSLCSADELQEWLSRVQFSRARFSRLMSELALIRKLEELFQAQLESRIDEQSRILNVQKSTPIFDKAMNTFEAAL